MENNPQPLNPPPRSRILLLDDHPIVREGLELRINQEPDLQVCGAAEDADVAMTLVRTTSPHLVLTDLSLQRKPGLEFIKDLRESHPTLPVIVLSIHDETLWAERVLAAGARGYLMKSQATQQLVNAIRHVLAGGTWISDQVRASLSRTDDNTALPASALNLLTDREMEVFHMIGNGLGPKEIAATLFLSVKTIETHREHIKAKLRLKNTSELVRYAAAHLMDNR